MEHLHAMNQGYPHGMPPQVPVALSSLPMPEHHHLHGYHMPAEMMPTQAQQKGDMEAMSDSDDDVPHHGGGHIGRSTAMMFDRSLVGDRNNLKTLIMRAVYENQIHLQTRKGDAFDHLAKLLGQREEFKPYKLHGRKLQKSFNKIARDIKDCIIQENEPSRWGKEEPEFFVIARKIFDEARRAGVRAFDEKLKSKAVNDRDGAGENEESARKRKKREYSYGGGAVPMAMNAPMTPGANLPIYGAHGDPTAAGLSGAAGNSGAGVNAAPEMVPLHPDFMKLIEDFILAKFHALQQQQQAGQVRLNSREIEASLAPVIDKIVSTYQLITIGALLDSSSISEAAKARIYDATHFKYGDDVKLFLILYCDIMMRSPQAIQNLQEAFGNGPEFSVRDATLLYHFIDQLIHGPSMTQAQPHDQSVMSVAAAGAPTQL